MQYLLTDPQAQSVVDLGLRDEDSVGLVSLTIHGFIGDSDRDVEREECVRLLVAQGADMAADKGEYHASSCARSFLMFNLRGQRAGRRFTMRQ